MICGWRVCGGEKGSRRPVFPKRAARKLANQAARPFQDEWAGLVQDVLELEDQIDVEAEGTQQ